MRVQRLLRVMAAVMCLTLVSCSKEGPTGPAGPQGPVGAGTRVVYSGAVTADASAGGQLISAPALHLDDLPLVAVYLMADDGTWIMANLVLFDPASGTNVLEEVAILSEGQVMLYSAGVAVAYKIVIVT